LGQAVRTLGRHGNALSRGIARPCRRRSSWMAGTTLSPPHRLRLPQGADRQGGRPPRTHLRDYRRGPQLDLARGNQRADNHQRTPDVHGRRGRLRAAAREAFAAGGQRLYVSREARGGRWAAHPPHARQSGLLRPSRARGESKARGPRALNAGHVSDAPLDPLRWLLGASAMLTNVNMALPIVNMSEPHTLQSVRGKLQVSGPMGVAKRQRRSWGCTPPVLCARFH